MIVANDATVKGGSYFPLTVKKHLRAQEVAEQNRLPCIYLVDSGGAFLPLQAEVFPDRDHFGRIFFNQARMSAQGIPQIAVVMGSCTAGGAYVPAMCGRDGDRARHRDDLHRRPAAREGGDRPGRDGRGARRRRRARAALRRRRPLRDLRRARARDRARHRRATSHGRAPEPPWDVAAPEPPALDPADLYGLIPEDFRHQVDPRELIARIVDGSRFHEFKQLLRRDARDAASRASRAIRVGILANNGVLFAESAQKGAHFIELCCKRRDPARLPAEHHRLHGRQRVRGRRDRARRREARDGGRECAEVPKFTVVIGGSFGAGNYGMCGRAYEPRQLWMWPNARISVMGGEQAATVLSMVGDVDQDEIRAKYEAEGNPYYSTARLWDDGIIDPLDTRRVLALGLAAARNAPIPETTFGIFRM